VKLNIYILKIPIFNGEHMRGSVRGLFVSAIIATCTIATSFVLLNHFYGSSSRNVSWEGIAPIPWGTAKELKPVILTPENSENVGTTFNLTNAFWYLGAYPSTWENAEQYNSAIWVYDNLTYSVSIIKWENADQLKPEVFTITTYRDNSMYGQLFPQQIGTEGSVGPRGAVPAVNVPFIVSETKSVNVLPISAIIGISMGFMVFSVWIGYKRMWGDATSTLLEQGLHDMTVRDVEIVGQIMDLEEFTIPELIRQTGASKITVWRTVQKLMEQGLIKQIEQTKPAANGLGGRGKPSRVYKYVGASSSETSKKL
jgi:predicted transcriptional regulator